MIRIAIVGYGNIGKYAVEAVEAAPDMELAGVVRRKASMGQVPPELAGVKIVEDIKELGEIDVAILATPSRAVPETAKKYLEMGISTVDSYDIHDTIYELRQDLTAVAKAHQAVSVISAGWDPGSDSIVRAMMQVLAPKGVTHTNFGEGMSMGHSVAARAVEGVKDALSVTIPVGTGIHRRMVYVELEDGAQIADVTQRIKADPYFAHDETHVKQVPDVDALVDMGHGVQMVRKGVSGKTQNQMLEFQMRINNPALTSQIMVSCARAATKQQPGCYTMIELPVFDMLCGDEEQLIRSLV